MLNPAKWDAAYPYMQRNVGRAWLNPGCPAASQRAAGAEVTAHTHLIHTEEITNKSRKHNPGKSREKNRAVFPLQRKSEAGRAAPLLE